MQLKDDGLIALSVFYKGGPTVETTCFNSVPSAMALWRGRECALRQSLTSYRLCNPIAWGRGDGG